mgnify:CR=1 FL=1
MLLGETITLNTSWKYDSWGRTKEIIYPDEEKVSYTYDKGGMLKKVMGYKSSGNTTSYIDNIDYDKYGQKTTVNYGNGTSTDYEYDPLTLRLSSQGLNTNGGMFYNHYAYDDVGNVKGKISEGYPMPMSMNDPVYNTYNYFYDADSRLTQAYGNDVNDRNIYSLNMTYSLAGRTDRKEFNATRTDNSGTHTIEIVNGYEYEDPNNPYAASYLSGTHEGKYTWDGNGNLKFVRSYADDSRQRLFWNVDNRLQGFADSHNAGFYRYDASGERDMKLTGYVIDIWQNGHTMHAPVLDQAVLYPSAFMTISERGYTKHYFADGERIGSSIGGGTVDTELIIDRINERIPLISGNYNNILSEYANFVMQFYKWRHSWGDDYEAWRACVMDWQSCEQVDAVYDEDGFNECPCPCLYEETILNIPSLKDAFKHSLYTADDTDEMYYYHSDHLGSGSVITDASGDIYQTLDYAPFGEILMDVKETGRDYDQRYRFTGHERDEETGFDYAHARYYWSDLGIFLSVDPLAEKRPWLTGYNYCSNNPINKIDPTGLTDYHFDENGDRKLNNDGSVQTSGSPNNPHRIAIDVRNSKNNIETHYYNLAAPANDAKQIENGQINKIIFVSEKEIQSIMEQQGAFESGKIKFGWNSLGGKNFDYSFTVLPNKYPDANFDGVNSNTLFIPERDYIAHNFMNFGNYLWGATGYTVGFNYAGLQSGAHMNSLISPRRNNYPSQWDSKDDQYSIKKGIYHAYINNYRNLKK